MEVLFLILFNLTYSVFYWNVLLKYCEMMDKPYTKKVKIKSTIVYFIISIILFFFQFKGDIFLYGSIFTIFQITIPIIFTVVFYGRKDIFKNIMVMIVLNSICCIFVVMQQLIIMILKFENLNQQYIFFIVYLLFCILPYLLLRKKMKSINLIEIFNNKKANGILFVLISVILFFLYSPWSKEYIYNNIGVLGYNILLFSSNIVVGIYLLVYIYIIYNRKNKALNELLIVQQESYINSLESMQEDIRKYNHDYKNLLTGALLQAEEGDYEGVRLYLKDVFDEFENKIGTQVAKTTQLKRIKSNEVKGLILSKISKMEDKGIEFHLEVLNEVDKINMKSTDLVRCLGILIDNAIEEVESLEEKIIKLIILKEENITTIMVKNPVTEKVNIQSIYEDNFSTKGEKRGLGLSNYREIIENYENIVRETVCTEKEFNQVLKIG